MSAESSYRTIECPHCKGVSEYDAAAGVEFNCPHCGEKLSIRPNRSSVKVTIGLMLGVLAMVVILFAVNRAFDRSAKKTSVALTLPSAPDSLSTNGFTISRLTLDPYQGRPRYVQGTASNQLQQQRFGVKIQFELFDTNEMRVGSASDYRPSIQSGEVWHFRALALESNAVSASVISIKEDQ